ncbi:MAG: helix-turn-helix domain-containing protein [bacterium]|nr:helix-turn-helix domain-containing protein [bacterium]
MSAQQVIIRVSVSEAAKLFGMNGRTIRRALATGELTYIVVRGRYKINFESLVRWSQQRPNVERKRDKAGIGQYVEKWRIRNTLYSPNPRMLESEEKDKKSKK